MAVQNKPNLPKLPAWHYWHVIRDFEGHYKVQIRVGWEFPFSIPIMQSNTYSESPSASDIEYKAQALMYKFEAKHQAKALLGSYGLKK